LIEALLANEALADEVWQRWYLGEIDDAMAFVAWWLIAYSDSIEPGHIW